MATFISLLTFTDQGIRNVKDTTKRARTFEETARKAGVTVREIFYTLGQYDLVSIVDAPDEATVMSLLLGVGSIGNVRTQTMRGFSLQEMEGVLEKLPKV
jgi:uncharacterized protein with GYD domain